MAVDERRIQDLVGTVIQNLHKRSVPASALGATTEARSRIPTPRIGEDGIFEDMDGCVAAAHEAQECLGAMSLCSAGAIALPHTPTVHGATS